MSMSIGIKRQRRATIGLLNNEGIPISGIEQAKRLLELAKKSCTMIEKRLLAMFH